MRVGVMLSQSLVSLDHVPLQALADAGVWAVLLRCFEDEIRWRAPAAEAFARSAAAAGLRVFLVPAGYGGIFCPEQHPTSLFVQAHPQVRQVDLRGRRIPRACPNNPAYIEWLASSLRTLAWLIDADGFVWEEPGFYYNRGLWTCRCSYCQGRYAAQFGGTMPAELSPQLAGLRQRSIADLVATISGAVKGVDSRLACLLMPTPAPQSGAIPNGNENWRMLSAVGDLDGLIVSWPPGTATDEPLSGALSLWEDLPAWVEHGTLMLLRLLCNSSSEEAALTLRHLAAADVPALVLECPEPLAADLSRGVKAILRMVAETA